jgi:hypothetical protein
VVPLPDQGGGAAYLPAALPCVTPLDGSPIRSRGSEDPLVYTASTSTATMLHFDALRNMEISELRDPKRHWRHGRAADRVSQETVAPPLLERRSRRGGPRGVRRVRDASTKGRLHDHGFMDRNMERVFGRATSRSFTCALPQARHLSPGGGDGCALFGIALGQGSRQTGSGHGSGRLTHGKG